MIGEDCGQLPLIFRLEQIIKRAGRQRLAVKALRRALATKPERRDKEATVEHERAHWRAVGGGSGFSSSPQDSRIRRV